MMKKRWSVALTDLARSRRVAYAKTPPKFWTYGGAKKYADEQNKKVERESGLMWLPTNRPTW